jgi:glucosylceramidase
MDENKQQYGGGKLRPDCYDVYADYLIKYIQAYKQEGIDIHTMTVQNEPNMAQPLILAWT